MTGADPRTIDTCGTGGDGADTFNISTAAAFVVAGAGVPVAKHGNRAASGRTGSFDVFEALGVDIDLPVETCGRILAEVGIGAFFARVAHPAFRFIAPVRQQLGIRTLMNCLGPLLNPMGVRHQLVGVYARDLVEPLAEALAALGAERALVVHGADGLDEITTCDVSHAALVASGRVRSLVIDPAQLGIARAAPDSLCGGDARHNAAITRRVLGGEPGPCRDIVLVNAAAARWVAGAAEDLADGLVQAARSIDSGDASARLEALVKASQEAA
jgi:anthranilate phosphoribosyltransferase